MKTTLRFHLTSVRMAVIKDRDRELLFTAGSNVNYVAMKISMEDPQKVKNTTAI
jgi:hypothetical protein